ncbi:MAG: hypothetical protein NVS4B8_21000 [Herpetosiphon sp.]
MAKLNLAIGGINGYDHACRIIDAQVYLHEEWTIMEHKSYAVTRPQSQALQGAGNAARLIVEFTVARGGAVPVKAYAFRVLLGMLPHGVGDGGRLQWCLGRHVYCTLILTAPRRHVVR